jgi:threonyl-tRNA synthetase
MERFIGILIENHAGALPLWLAPVQVVVMNVTDRQESYVRESSARCARPVSASPPICGTRK